MSDLMPAGDIWSETLPAAIEHQARVRPQAPAVVAPGKRPLSYLELAALLDEIGCQLRRRGLGRKSRVGIALPAGPEAAVAYIAVACHAIAVPIDPDTVEAELEDRCTDLRLDAVAVLDAARTAAETVARRRGIDVIRLITEGDAAGRIALAPGPHKPAPPAAVEAARPEDIALILNTSGTTGRLKLVPLSHRNLAAMAAKMRGWMSLSHTDRNLSVGPLHYSQGLRQSVFTPVVVGASIAFPAGTMSPQRLWAALEELAPTCFATVPTLLLHLLEFARGGRRSAHRLRFIRCGGSDLAEGQRRELEELLGVPVLIGYGLSEAGLIVSSALPPTPSRPGSVGIADPDEVKIAGPDGERLATGAIGEILLHGPCVMPGYLDDPALNSAAFDKEGWFRTGDLGAVDGDGFLTIEGRLKELINRGGEKVAPAELDRALLRHPAVAEAAAFGVPHPRLGEDVAAAVVLRPGSATGAAELRAFLRDELAPFKIPHRIAIVAALPKSEAGKVRRTDLPELLAARPLPAAAEEPGPLEAELLRLWRRLLDRDDFGLDDDFFDLGGDSLLATQMLLAVESLTGSALPAGILFETANVRGLARLLGGAAELPQRPLITLQSGGAATPFFFFPGVFDDVGYYTRRLARLLGSVRAFVAVPAIKPRGRALLPAIEAMAERHAAAILAAEPQGPLSLGGFCSGGLVAFATARELVARGRTVECVALIDSPSFAAGRPLGRWLYRWLWGAFLLRASEGSALGNGRRAVIARHLDALFLALRPFVLRRRPGAWSPDWEVPDERPVSRKEKQWQLVVRRHEPQPAPVPVIFFAAENDGEPWRPLAREIEIVELDCVHVDCVTTRLDFVAARLRARLERGAGAVSG